MIDFDFTEFAQSVVKDAKLNLGAYRSVNGKRRRSVATGRGKESVDYILQGEAGVKFVGEDYLLVVEGGRRKGAKQPPILPIMKWIEAKGLKPREDARADGLQGRRFASAGRRTDNRLAALKRMATRIARSISKKGIAPTYFMTQAVEKNLEMIPLEVASEFEAAVTQWADRLQ